MKRIFIDFCFIVVPSPEVETAGYRNVVPAGTKADFRPLSYLNHSTQKALQIVGFRAGVQDGVIGSGSALLKDLDASACL